jgi:hypothetical protein
MVVFSASIILFDLMAKGKFSYVKPSNASPSDREKVPESLRVIVDHNIKMRVVGLIVFWIACVAALLTKGSGSLAEYVCFVLAVAGGFSYALAVSWRMWTFRKIP